MADSSNSTLIYIEEDVFGVIPTAKAPKEFRFSGSSLSYSPKFIESEEIVAGAQVGDVIRVGADPKGDVNIVFAPSAHDDMLEAAFRDVWTPPRRRRHHGDGLHRLRRHLHDHRTVRELRRR
ncbi:phage tail tube protein [Azospirillum brasilense]|uniref:phage tail tube protein n=1 Tax=Azospirillum brasilense TaxID=192 RepID=UPI00157A2BDA|nr:phage tail tube protein [Azospirillum brasilense]NUB30685.1 hypothetical protein [Azospirillum brasilense]